MQKEKEDLSKFTADKQYVKMLLVFYKHHDVACWKKIHDTLFATKQIGQCYESFIGLKNYCPLLFTRINYDEAIKLEPSFKTFSKRNAFFKLTKFGHKVAESAEKTKKYTYLLKLLSTCTSLEEANMRLVIEGISEDVQELNKETLIDLAKECYKQNLISLGNKFMKHSNKCQ